MRLIEDYKSTVNRTLGIVCKAQSWVSVICAVGIWMLSEKVSPEHGRIAIIMTLISIPSVALWGQRKIRRYEEQSWREEHPSLDFSGTWDSSSEFLVEIKVSATELSSIGNEGCIVISQTPFHLKLDSCSLRQKNSQEDLGGFDWLSASMSDDGKYIYTVYKMVDLHDQHLKDQRSHGIGYQLFEAREWENNDPRKRPKRMSSYWYDCVKEDQTTSLYIGKTTYHRRSSD